MDIFNINTPMIDTITISSKIELKKHDVEKQEYYSTSENNITKLKKIANFTSWNFRIYKTTESDSTWSTLVSNLEALNTGEPMDCEIDTIDNSGTIYSCYFDCYYNRESEYPNKFIECNLYRVYSNGNEVSGGGVVSDYIAFYKMDDNLANTNVIDEKDTYNGTANENTSLMSTTGVKGVSNTALHFDQTTNYIDLGTDFGKITNNVTVTFWANTGSYVSSYYFSMYYSGLSSDRSGFQIDNFLDTIYVRKSITSSSVITLSSSNETFRDGYHFFTVTISDTTGVTIYLDKINIGNNSNTADIRYSSLVPPSTNVPKSTIGAQWRIISGTNSWTSFFDGDIDNVRIYDRVLETSEIEAIYNDEKA